MVALTAEGRAVHARFGEVHCRIAEALGITTKEAAQLRDLLRNLSA